MSYIGLRAQIQRNNLRSLLLLIGFPALVLIGYYAILLFGLDEEIQDVNYQFISTVPLVLLGVGVWFVIAYFSHSAIIKATSHAQTLSRKENMRVYNLTENLCMSVGMTMPKLLVIQSPALNAFASGLDANSYTVTLTTGIIETLDDDELAGVIAHELTHIRNRDVRLLVISIIFVGIFAFLVQIISRTFLYGGGRRRNDKVDGRVMLVAMIVTMVVYFLSILFRFALSRKREYLADAGAVEITKNSHALASALRKISGNHDVDVQGEDLKQMFIENSPKDKSNFMSSLSGLFATHPPIEKRIAILEKGL